MTNPCISYVQFVFNLCLKYEASSMAEMLLHKNCFLISETNRLKDAIDKMPKEHKKEHLRLKADALSYFI